MAVCIVAKRSLNKDLSFGMVNAMTNSNTRMKWWIKIGLVLEYHWISVLKQITESFNFQKNFRSSTTSDIYILQ